MQMIVVVLVCNSLTFSSLWWAKAPGVKYCQIPRGSTFVSFCHSFLTTMLQSRTAPSVTFSTTKTLALEIPFILHKNCSEVRPSSYLPCGTPLLYNAEWIFASLSHHNSYYLKPDGYFNPEVVKYRQLCGKSQRKRQLYSLQQYYHRLLKQILVSRKVFLLKFEVQGTWPLAVSLNVPSCCRSCWSSQFTMVWTFLQKES